MLTLGRWKSLKTAYSLHGHRINVSGDYRLFLFEQVVLCWTRSPLFSILQASTCPKITERRNFGWNLYPLPLAPPTPTPMAISFAWLTRQIFSFVERAVFVTFLCKKVRLNNQQSVQSRHLDFVDFPEKISQLSSLNFWWHFFSHSPN